jgi:hypothetical protein
VLVLVVSLAAFPVLLDHRLVVWMTSLIVWQAQW